MNINLIGLLFLVHVARDHITGGAHQTAYLRRGRRAGGAALVAGRPQHRQAFEQQRQVERQVLQQRRQE